jgi:CxxC motif-containing protein (DUF1111 family)
MDHHLTTEIGVRARARRTKTLTFACVLSSAALLATGGCTMDIEAEPVGTRSQAVVGDFIPGLIGDAGMLTEARNAFDAVESIHDGVGPIFNGNACGQCHTNGALGGAGEQIERRFGRFAGGSFNSLSSLGGSLRQLFTAGNFQNADLPAASRGKCQSGNPTLCCVPQEQEPTTANVKNVGRRTQPLFGLGLVDAMPDSFFDQLAASQPAAIRGKVRRVSVLVPNPGDPTQFIGSTRVARFGWKAGVPSLLQFSADAYLNEMAITTQSCFEGTSVNAFAVEPAPNGTAMPSGCDDLAAPQVSPNPGGLTVSQWSQVDDAVGSCDGARTEIQDDVFLFAAFMTALAPPPREVSNPSTVAAGAALFASVGCSGCHTASAFVTPANPAPVDIGNGEEIVRVPGNYSFYPFSDFLLHDMGSLGDGIGEDGENAAATRSMRTQPLWGNRLQNKLLHDGRCTDITCAVQAHDGQGAASKNAFNSLTSLQKQTLTQYVRTL